MYKQVIVVNKSLNMSPGKLGAMVAHGATSFFCEWFKRNVITSNETYNDYLITPNARVDKELFAQWISGSFTKIVLEVEDDAAMKTIIEKAHEYGMVNRQDFFNIVDESTEFLDIPQWAVIAFKPMEAEKIDPITGELNLYGYEEKMSMEYKCLPYIMRYMDYEKSPFRGMYINIARWCNQPSFFKKKTFREFCIMNGKESSCMKYAKYFEQQCPDIAEKYYDLRFTNK